jgi:hypothetical protein
VNIAASGNVPAHNGSHGSGQSLSRRAGPPPKEMITADMGREDHRHLVSDNDQRMRQVHCHIEINLVNAKYGYRVPVSSEVLFRGSSFPFLLT